jgi:hypothetical protein
VVPAPLTAVLLEIFDETRYLLDLDVDEVF